MRNRFKGLDLIDRVPDEIWTEVRDIVQETGIKTIPMEKKSKKAKWLSEGALQIAVKRREVKSNGENEGYKHLNAEFQKTARRDKKAFLNDQCKEIEENNRMGKTRVLFKQIRDTKGTFHAKMGTIKARILEWVAVSSSRGSSQPRDRTWNTSNWWLFWSKHCFDCLFLFSTWNPWEFWFNWFGYWSPRADCLNITGTIQVALRSQHLRKRYTCVPKRETIHECWGQGRG